MYVGGGQRGALGVIFQMSEAESLVSHWPIQASLDNQSEEPGTRLSLSLVSALLGFQVSVPSIWLSIWVLGVDSRTSCL